jgi:mannose/cellobiose epimerase-like protein (N-acyl-D-glucosamine 2-epimerase family)
MLRVVALAAAAGAAMAEPTPAPPALARLVPALERNLHENIIRFWYPRCIDRRHGGYLVAFDPSGQPRTGATKMIVTQARMLWLSSRLLREGHQPALMREAADHGFAFLVERMWDPRHGGFFWEVDESGRTVTKPNKHLYGQAFGLYALAEYARAARRPDARRYADRLFQLLEDKAHDGTYGGYVEFFAPDWSAPPPEAQSYLGAPERELKLMNTHLHLMEALTTYFYVKPAPLVRERLTELVTIQSSAVVRKTVAASTDQHRRDWRPRLTPDAARASYGHDLENIWLLVEAQEALGRSPYALLDLFRELFLYAQVHGYDDAQGGFFYTGPLGRPADDRRKEWWVQAEALVSALTMHRLTREAQYADAFERTWRWVNERQTDWAHGEWHQTILADGTIRGDKGHVWKAGYHNGRAMLECLRLLKKRSPGSLPVR